MSRQDVYSAEYGIRFALENGGTIKAYGSTFTLPEERKFGDLAGVKRYVDLVWAACGRSDEPPSVRKRRGATKAHYEFLGHCIAVPDHDGIRHSWAMREIVILHEIAHAMTRHEHEDHGPLFCGTHVALLSRFIGAEVGFLFLANLHEHGVQVTKTTV